MSDKLKIRLSFLGGLIFWLLFAGSNVYLMLVKGYEMKVDYSDFLPQLSFTLFTLSTFIHYRYIITKADTLNFSDLLWKVFITGLVTTLLSLGIQGFFVLFEGRSAVESPLIIHFFYNILVGLIVIFAVSTFVVWKRLILYQKSKNLLQLWRFFELAFGVILIVDFFGFKPGDAYFSVGLVVLVLFSLVLVFNLKWVAYLNFKQKWKGILFILLSGIYLYHFLRILNWFSGTNILVIDMLERVFILGLFGFLFVYAIISILVTLFNLPTSSVFEQKLKEAVDFQKLSQTIPRGETNEQTYEILIESAMSAVFADAAWLEINDGEMQTVTRNLSAAEVDTIKSKIDNQVIQDIITLTFQKGANPTRLNVPLKHTTYKTIMALPIWVQDQQVGFIVLLNEVAEAFNREMVSIVTTFVNQASTSLENLVLIKESLANERYKEQLSIAKTVQKSLLPTEVFNNEALTVEALSVAADEVGGDYYDILAIDQDQYGLIIGDVSGKGTSAAFQMAQMKGVFHSLVREKLSPKVFIQKTNQALSQCLDKSAFITATYFEIDTQAQTLSFSRAGHCPGLLYSAKKKEVSLLEEEGMGLGILRNSTYDKYVVESTVPYSGGDVLLLYTDGITEAKNETGEQFGEERLKQSFLENGAQPPNLIKKAIKEALKGFMGSLTIDDDYTLLVIQLKSHVK